MTLFESNKVKLGKKLANNFDLEEANFFQDGRDLDERVGEIYEEFKKEHGESQIVKDELKRVRNSWFAIKGFEQNVKLDDFNLDPIDVDTASIEDLEKWEKGNLEKLDSLPFGFLYRNQFRQQIGDFTTHFIRNKANEDPEDQGFLGDLVDGVVDLPKRVIEGAGVGFAGVFDREGDKIQAVQRFLTTDPENDGGFFSDLAGGLGSVVPSVGSAVVGGAVGSFFSPAGTVKGATAGALVGSAGFNLASRTNEAYRTTMALTNNEKLAEESWMGQLPAVAVDTFSDLVITRFIKPLKATRSNSRMREAAQQFKGAKNVDEKLAVIKKYEKDIITASAEGALGEAIAEPLGEILSAYGLDNSIRDEKIEEAIAGAPRSAIIGGILGASVSGVLEGRQKIPQLSIIKDALKQGLVLDDVVDVTTGKFKSYEEINDIVTFAAEQKLNEPTSDKTTEELEQIANLINNPNLNTEGTTLSAEATEAQLAKLKQDQENADKQGINPDDLTIEQPDTDTEETSTETPDGTGTVEEGSKPALPETPSGKTEEVEASEESGVDKSEVEEEQGSIADKDRFKKKDKFKRPEKQDKFDKDRFDKKFDDTRFDEKKSGQPNTEDSNNVDSSTEVKGEDVTSPDPSETASGEVVTQGTANPLFEGSIPSSPSTTDQNKVDEVPAQDTKVDEQEVLNITKKNGDGFAKESGVKGAIKRQQLDPENFDIVKQDDGSFIGRSKVAEVKQEQSETVKVDTTPTPTESKTEPVKDVPVKVDTPKPKKINTEEALEADRQRFREEQEEALKTQNRINPRAKSVEYVIEKGRGREDGNANVAVDANKYAGYVNLIEKDFGNKALESVLLSIDKRFDEFYPTFLARSGTPDTNKKEIREDFATRAVSSITGRLYKQKNAGEKIDVKKATDSYLVGGTKQLYKKFVTSSLAVVKKQNLDKNEAIGDRPIVESDLQKESSSPVPAMRELTDILKKSKLSDEDIVEVGKTILTGEKSTEKSKAANKRLISSLANLDNKDKRKLRDLILEIENSNKESKKVKGKSVTSGKYSYRPVKLSKVLELDNSSSAYNSLKLTDPNVQFLESTDQSLSELTDEIQSIYGVDHNVVYFASNDPDIADGAYDSFNNTVFINTKTQRPMELIMAHESAHALAEQNPELFKAIQSRLIKNGLKLPSSSQQTRLNSYNKSLRPEEYMADVIARAFLDARTLGHFEAVLDDNSLFKKFTSFLSNLMQKMSLKFRDVTTKWFDSENWEAMDVFEDSYVAAHIFTETLAINKALSTEKLSAYHVNDGLVNDFNRQTSLLEQIGLPRGVARAGTYLSKNLDENNKFSKKVDEDGDGDRNFMKELFKKTGSLITGKAKKPKNIHKDSILNSADEKIESAEKILFNKEPFKEFQGTISFAQAKKLITVITSKNAKSEKAIGETLTELQADYLDLGNNVALGGQVIMQLFIKKIHSDLSKEISVNNKLRLIERIKDVADSVTYDYASGSSSLGQDLSNAGQTVGFGGNVNAGKGYKSLLLGAPVELINASRNTVKRVLGVRAGEFIDNNLKTYLEKGWEGIAGVLNQNSEFDTTRFEETTQRVAENTESIIDRTINILKSFSVKQSKKKDVVESASQREQAIKFLEEAKGAMGGWKSGQGLNKGLDGLDKMNSLMEKALELDWTDDIPSSQKAKIEKVKDDLKDQSDKSNSKKDKVKDEAGELADTAENQFLRKRRGAQRSALKRFDNQGEQTSEFKKKYTKLVTQLNDGKITKEEMIDQLQSKYVNAKLLGETIDLEVSLNQLRKAKEVTSERSGEDIELATTAYKEDSISATEMKYFVNYDGLTNAQKKSIDNLIDTKQRKADKLRDRLETAKSKLEQKKLSDITKRDIELATTAYKEDSISATEMKYFVNYDGLTNAQKKSIDNLIDTKQRKADKLRDSEAKKRREEALAKLQKFNELEAVVAKLGDVLPQEVSILRSLGVGQFAVKGALEYNVDEKGNLDKVSKVLPKNLQPKAGEIKKLIDSHVKGEIEIDTLVEGLADIKEQMKPKRKLTLNKWLSEKITDVNFKHDTIEEKRKALTEFFKDNNDKELQGVLERDFNITGQMSDAQVERMTLIAMKRFDQALETMRDKVLQDMVENFPKGKVKLSTLQKAITLGLYDMSISPNALITQALGKDYSIPIDTINKFTEVDERLAQLKKDGKLTNERIADLRKVETKNAWRELKKHEPSMGTPLIRKLQTIRIANLFSSVATVVGLPVGGGVSAITDTIVRGLVSSAGDKESMAIFRRALTDAFGISNRNLVQNFTAVQSFMDGAKNGIHAIGDVNALNDVETNLDSGSDLMAEQLDLLMKTIQNASSFKDAGKIAKEVTLAISSLPTGIFKVMGGIDAVFANAAIKIEREMQIDWWRKEAKIEKKDLDGGRKFAQQKVDSFYNTYLNFTNLTPSEKAIQANEFYYSTFFSQLSNDPEVVRKALVGSELLVNGMTGNNRVVFGPFTAIISGVLAAKNNISDSNFLAKWILDILAFPFLMIPSAASNADTMLTYIPFSGDLMRWVVDKSPASTLESKSKNSWIKMIQAWDAMLDHGKLENDLQQRRKFGVASSLMLFFALNLLKTGEDDDEKPLVDITLGYPDDQKERAKWTVDSIREYNLYVNTPDGGRWNIDFGRGTLPQLGLAAYASEKLNRLRKSVTESKTSSELVSKTINELWNGTAGEVRDLALPVFASIIESDNWQSDKGTTKKLNRFLATFQPFYSANKDVDILFNGRKESRTDEFTWNAFPIAAMFSDDRVDVHDGYGLVSGSSRNWVNNLRLPLGYRDMNERYISKEKFDNFKLLQNVNWFRSRISPTKFGSTEAFLGTLSDEQIGRLLVKNGVRNEADLTTKYIKQYSDNLSANITRMKNRRGIGGVRETLNELKKQRRSVVLERGILTVPRFENAKKLEKIDNKIKEIMKRVGGEATTKAKKQLGIDRERKKARRESISE